MRIRIALILDMLHALALALWLGGLVTVIGVAIPAFASKPDWLASDPKRLIGLLLPIYGRIVEISGLALVGVQFVLRRRYMKSRTHFITDGVRQLLTFGAFFLAEFAHYNLFPTLLAADARFQAAQNRFVALGIAQFVLLVLVIGISAWLMLPPPRSAGASGVEPSPTPSQPAPASAKKTKKR
jgi:putative copper export protein